MNRDLFLSILALDSYNRGYAPRVSGLSDDIGTSIGTAQIKRRVLDTDTQSVSADFYAIAYEWGGETIISYRGTDGLNDILTGWTVGAGWTDQAQANLANDNQLTDWRNAA